MNRLSDYNKKSANYTNPEWLLVQDYSSINGQRVYKINKKENLCGDIVIIKNQKYLVHQDRPDDDFILLLDLDFIMVNSNQDSIGFDSPIVDLEDKYEDIKKIGIRFCKKRDLISYLKDPKEYNYLSEDVILYHYVLQLKK